MDPVTHTMVGVAIAEAGLKRRTALGTATLVIGANLPDVDVLSLFWGPETGLWFRRGATHGVLALVVLPFVLTLGMWGWSWARRSKYSGSTDVRLGQVLLLAFLAVMTHPLLDFLNVYGMRWLMPFRETWYYADTLFIVDPWVWVMLAAGVFLARKNARANRVAVWPRPARVALSAMTVYIALMAASNVAARSIVSRAAVAQELVPVRLMVAPVAVNPFRRSVVVQDDTRYHFGTMRWLARPMVEFADLTYESRPSHPAAGAALRGPRPRRFLSWARFPYFQVEAYADHYLVRIADARYTLDPERSWAATEVVVGRAPSNP